MCDYMLIRGLEPVVWLDDQGLEKKMIGKFMTKKSGEEICKQASLNGQ